MTCVTAEVPAAFAKATMLEIEVQRCWHSLVKKYPINTRFDLDVEKYSPSARWTSTARGCSPVRCTLIGIAEGEPRVNSWGAVAIREHEYMSKGVLI